MRSNKKPAVAGLFEVLADAGLFEHRVGGVPGLDVVVDGEGAVGYRAPPDLVVTPALPFEDATVVAQDALQLRVKPAITPGW